MKLCSKISSQTSQTYVPTASEIGDTIEVQETASNSGGAGRLWGDGQHGRIYRIRWAGTSTPASSTAPASR